MSASDTAHVEILRRMPRRWFALVVLLLAMMCALTLTIWARSYFACDSLHFTGRTITPGQRIGYPDRSLSVGFREGGLLFRFASGPLRPDRDQPGHTWSGRGMTRDTDAPDDAAEALPPSSFHWFKTLRESNGEVIHLLRIPLLVIAGLFGIPLLCICIKAARRVRSKSETWRGLIGDIGVVLVRLLGLASGGVCLAACVVCFSTFSAVEMLEIEEFDRPHLGVAQAHQTTRVISANGSVHVVHIDSVFSTPRTIESALPWHRLYRRERTSASPKALIPLRYEFAGIGYERRELPDVSRPIVYTRLKSPWWPFIVIAGLLPVTLIIRGWPRPAPGICVRCGYDLRASPDRCPECGHRSATARRVDGA